MEWTPEIIEDVENLKKEMTESPCLAHFDPKKDNYVTTDACNTGLGATLWQKEGELLRPIAFASRFLTDCERKEAINELELLGALTVMGVRVIQILRLRKKGQSNN